MLAVLLEQFSRQASGLTPEHEVIVILEDDVAVKVRAVGFDVPKARALREAGSKGRPTGPAMPFHMLPVIHSRALELRVIQPESKGLNEIKYSARRGAQSGNVSSIGWDFRFNEDDVHKTPSIRPTRALAPSYQPHADPPWPTF